MKLLPLLILFLTACVPVTAEAEAEVIEPAVTVTRPAVAPDIDRISAIWYYGTTWDYCVVNDERVENVSFTWTDLGQSMIVGDQLIYYPEFRITECRATIKE